ncbi:hypothetical protein ES703_31141 [subsurface metagenome]
MALKGTTGSALSLGGGGLGLASGNGHAYAATATILGLSLVKVALVVAGGVLLVVGVKKLMASNSKKPKTAQT